MKGDKTLCLPLVRLTVCLICGFHLCFSVGIETFCSSVDERLLSSSPDYSYATAVSGKKKNIFKFSELSQYFFLHLSTCLVQTFLLKIITRDAL